MSILSQFYGGSGGTTLPIPISPDAFRIDIVVVGGGGGSGTNGFFHRGGGGGRVIEVFGTLIEKNKLYTVTVGAGGPVNNTNTAGSGTNGGDSAFAGYLAQGGGTPNSRTGGRGGSGCGNSIPTLYSSLSTYLGTNPNDTSLIFSYGNSGGAGQAANVSTGGGGGAGSIGGASGTGGQGGNGGAGHVTYIPIDNGLTVARGGGGGGFSSAGPPTGDGANFTGNGGGSLGGGDVGGGSGGRGTVYVAYPNTFPLATTTGNPILFSALAPIPSEIRTGYNVYQFIGSGTITFN